MLLSVSTLNTPNARMIENCRPCPADYYPSPQLQDPPYIHVKGDSRKVNVTWQFPPKQANKKNPIYLVKFYNVDTQNNYHPLKQFHTNKTSHEFDVQGGQFYSVIVFRVTGTKNVAQNTAAIQFKAIFSQGELDKLYDLAADFVKNVPMIPFLTLHRCKPFGYWKELIAFGSQPPIMIPYIKDHSGHPASPINGQIRGLFFFTNKYFDNMPFYSYFGDTAFSVNIGQLFHPQTTNMYFADFYCFYREESTKPHYVTIIFCTKGSPADVYCLLNTKPLDVYQNPFLRFQEIKNPKKGQSRFAFHTSPTVNVEVFYTNQLSFTFNSLYPVLAKGYGTSSKYGKPSNSFCKQCNIYRAECK